MKALDLIHADTEAVASEKTEYKRMADKKTEAPVVVAKAEDIEDIQEDVPF